MIFECHLFTNTIHTLRYEAQIHLYGVCLCKHACVLYSALNAAAFVFIYHSYQHMLSTLAELRGRLLQITGKVSKGIIVCGYYVACMYVCD